MKQIQQNLNLPILKRLAKKLKKEKGLAHHEALDQTAKELGFNNWKHLVSKSCSDDLKNSPFKKPIISKESLEKLQKDPYRNLLIAAINELVIHKHISLTISEEMEVNVKGYIFTTLFNENSVIIWRDIGFGELQISVWWKYDHSKHPQANLNGNYQENFNSATPLAKKVHFKKFVGVTVSCWLERKTGKYIQGENLERIFAVYTRKGEIVELKKMPYVNPIGYKASGPFRF